jgi:formate hydrogenlyase subunit 3/multisubunit Na+/H+ antiporter MnhD subunit
MGAFSIAAFGMIGVPPLAGFISKWHLAIGGVAANQPWIVAVLLVSTLLNAAYFLPILQAAWFKTPNGGWTVKRRSRFFETPWMLLLPAVITASFSLAAGLFATLDGSPLALARFIAGLMYAHRL